MGNKKKKTCKPLSDAINCFFCNCCTYIGEGDHICDMNNEIVVSDWEPTDKFYQCEGKEFERL